MAVPRRRPASALGMFARFWTPGRVNTRLAAEVGDAAAAELQRAFVQTLARRLGRQAERRLVAVTPEGRIGEVAAVAGPLWAVTGQGEGTLGDRLGRAFRSLLSSCRTAIVIGSDSPDLPIERVETAFAQLRSHAGVLGGAADGGYYLLGLAGPWEERHRTLFQRIDWGTADVAEQTRGRMRDAGMEWYELEPWFDVDRYQDLMALRQRLARGFPADPLGAQIDRILAASGRSEPDPVREPGERK